MLELLCKGLYEHGFTVMTAADGETGLDIATAHEFDSIMLDIGLPRLDGYGTDAGPAPIRSVIPDPLNQEP